MTSKLTSILNFEWLQQSDKQKHLIAGVIITLLFGYINLWIGLVACIILGYLKELARDYLMKKGTAEWKDVFATWLGGLIALIGIGVVLLFKWGYKTICI